MINDKSLIVDNRYNWLNILIKLIPLGGVFLIFCGAVSQISYYSLFNISIENYLSLNEYVALMFIDILHYLGLLVFGILYFTLFIKFFTDKLTGRVILIFVLIWILGVSIIQGFSFDTTSNILLNIRNTMLVLILALFTYLKIKKYPYSFIIAITSSFFCFSIFQGFIKAQYIFERPTGVIVEFKIDRFEITTNENVKYLGQTADYIFFYDLSSSSALIHSKDNLEYIKVHKVNDK